MKRCHRRVSGIREDDNTEIKKISNLNSSNDNNAKNVTILTSSTDDKLVSSKVDDYQLKLAEVIRSVV